MRSERARGRALARALALASLFACAAAACVDGVTPDCSDPHIACGPITLEAGSDAADASSVIPDATPDAAGGDAADGAASDGDADADGRG